MAAYVLHLVRRVGLVGLAITACTPVPAGEQAAIEPDPCAAIVIAPGERAELYGDRLRALQLAVREQWAVPQVLIRRAEPLKAIPDMELYVVDEAGRHPRRHRCYVDLGLAPRDGAPPPPIDDSVQCDEAGLQWAAARAEARLPADELHDGMIRLIATLDRAERVFDSSRHAQRCLTVLPEQLLADVEPPSAGRNNEGQLVVQLVEEVRAGAWRQLLKTRMSMTEGAHRTEIVTWEDAAPTEAVPEPSPTWTRLPPDDPPEAQRDAACPSIRYPHVSPSLHAGQTFERIAAVTGEITEIAQALHPVALEGVRFYHAYDFSTGCMKGWNHENCFVGYDAVHCSGTEDDLVRFVTHYGLERDPSQLDDAAWIDLVAAFSGADERIASTDALGLCVPDKHRASDLPPRVSPSLVEVTVAHGHDTIVRHRLHLGDELRHEADVLWTQPDE